jgi:hypothetical protein
LLIITQCALAIGAFACKQDAASMGPVSGGARLSRSILRMDNEEILAPV